MHLPAALLQCGTGTEGLLTWHIQLLLDVLKQHVVQPDVNSVYGRAVCMIESQGPKPRFLAGNNFQHDSRCHVYAERIGSPAAQPTALHRCRQCLTHTITKLPSYQSITL